jgi:hypothetical protein
MYMFCTVHLILHLLCLCTRKKLIKLEENLADFQKNQVSDQIKGLRIFYWLGDREIIQTEKN